MYPLPSTASTNAWPQKLAVSPDGRRLLVPLNLAGSADVIDLEHHDQVRNVVTGSYPFGAAILPDGRTGLVSNEAAGTLSVVDLVKGVKLRDIQVGPPLSHPQGIVVDRAGRRAYVALSALDEVVVVDLQAPARRAHDLGGSQRRPRDDAGGARAQSRRRAPVRRRVGRRRDRRRPPAEPEDEAASSSGRWWGASRRPKTRRPWSP